MSRRDELLRLASLFQSQANIMSGPATKRAFQRMADIYQHEADLLRRQPATEIAETNSRHTRPIRSAA